MYSAIDSSNIPEVGDDLIGAAIVHVSDAVTIITGNVFPVDGDYYTGGGVPCQT